MQTYGKAVADMIIKCRAENFEVCDDGVRPVGIATDFVEGDQLLNWTPQCELDGEDAPDPLSTPALPIPFNAKQLAAFLMHGSGYFIRQKFGGWADGPEQQALDELGIQAQKAKQALIEAFIEYRAAEQVCGTYDKRYSENIIELEAQVEQLPESALAKQRINQAWREADAYEADWRKRMVSLLLGFGDLPSTLARLAETTAPPLKHRNQEKRILELLTSLNLDPFALPPIQRGKWTVKATIREHAMKDRRLFSENSFNKAWQRLRDDGRIKEFDSNP